MILGLQDDYDIKMLSHLILVIASLLSRISHFDRTITTHIARQVKFAQAQAFTVLANVGTLVEPMTKTLKTKPKSSAVKNEVRSVQSSLKRKPTRSIKNCMEMHYV